MTDRYELKGEKYVTCSCSHMTSFAVIMDIANDEVSTVNYLKISQWTDFLHQLVNLLLKL